MVAISFGSYITAGENIMDFLIVLSSLVSLLPMDVNLTTCKIARMARLLRPLKMISKNDGLKLSITALAVSLPAIGSLMVIVFLILFMFAVVGVNLLKGKSYYCYTDNLIGFSPFETESLISTE